MKLLYRLALLLVIVSACRAQGLMIVDNGVSQYSIVVPATATPQEQRMASVLQDYIGRVSGVKLPIAKEGSASTANAIFVGRTTTAVQVAPGELPYDGYHLQVRGKDVVICGGNGKGLTYGVYTFIEKYLGCRKPAEGPAVVTRSKRVEVPLELHEDGRPQFIYRESYYPAAQDAEYREWHQLQQFEELWGLWGHSYDKLVPAATYFKSHPEYYAMVRGVRKPSQLCLSNEDVYRIVTEELKRRIADNPDAIYWSVSPNDDIGHCECDKCKATDNAQGGPSGSLIQFVNRVAAQFPDKYITTLAYGYTHRAPKDLKPANNVFVFLTTIDAYRQAPLAQDPSAATFRNDVKAWGALTKNLFVWDYVTQFTNYLAPFPNLLTLQPNMQYFKDNGIKGVLAQGSGDTYGEWAELRSYLLSNLLVDSKADVKALTETFLQDHYGPAAKFMLQYIGQLHNNREDSKRRLDIYGNPVNEWNSYLTPDNLKAYSDVLDAAAGAVADKPVYAARVLRARLPVEYTILQQARFFGIEEHGMFFKDRNGQWKIREGLQDRIAKFVKDCKKAGVKVLSEGGMSPDGYKQQWAAILSAGVRPTIATDAKVTLKYPFAPEYPAKGNRTLVDGNPGYDDFSYNWLCFYGQDMVATVDLGAVKDITSVGVDMLDDPRHWILLPTKVVLEASTDGKQYTSIGNYELPPLEEHYDLKIDSRAIAVKLNARYIRVTAYNLRELPEWRYREHKKPMIACSEVWVQ